MIIKIKKFVKTTKKPPKGGFLLIPEKFIKVREGGEKLAKVFVGGRAGVVYKKIGGGKFFSAGKTGYDNPMLGTAFCFCAD